MELTHRFLRLNLTHTGTNEDFHYVDIAQQLSLINRRLYRQGMTYHVANVAVHDSQGDAYVKFCTIPNTWTSKAAWKQGFKLWKKQRAMAQSGGANVSGKWSDFKVYMNDDHRTDVDKPQFTDIENDSLEAGEWDYSMMLLDTNGEATDDFSLHMMGNNNGSLPAGTCVSASLLKALEDVLNQPADDPVAPDASGSGLFTLMAHGGDGLEVNMDVVNQMEDDNDSPPYSATKVPGASFNAGDPWEVREIHLGSGGVAPSGMVGGFEVPLGLICIETKSGTNPNTIGVIIEIVPGKYKGVHAQGWA